MACACNALTLRRWIDLHVHPSPSLHFNQQSRIDFKFICRYPRRDRLHYEIIFLRLCGRRIKFHFSDTPSRCTCKVYIYRASESLQPHFSLEYDNKCIGDYSLQLTGTLEWGIWTFYAANKTDDQFELCMLTLVKSMGRRLNNIEHSEVTCKRH